MKLMFYFSLFYLVIPSCAVEETNFKSDTKAQTAFDPENPMDNLDDVLAACAKATETTKSSINFPARKGCSWSQNGNLNKNNGHLTARESQESLIDIPDGVLVCGISMTSIETNVTYDDGLIMALNNNLLFSKSVPRIRNLDKKNDLYQWDWNNLDVGESWDDKPNDYCLGECTIPETQTTGSFSYSLTEKDSAAVIVNNGRENDLNFKLIITGDDNDSDCSHSGLSFEVEVLYLK